MMYDIRRIDYDLPQDQQQRVIASFDASDGKQALTYFFRKHDIYMGYTQFLEPSINQCFATSLSAVHMATLRN